MGAAASLLVLVILGGAVAWLWWSGAVDGARDRIKDLYAALYPSRPLSRRALPRRLLRAAEHTLTVGVSGTVLVPTRIEIAVNPADLAPFAEALDWLGRDIAEALRKKAAARGWVVPGGPQVVITSDADRPMRMPRAVGHIGALSPRDVPTLRRTAPTIATCDLRAVHLRLVSTAPGDGEGDLSAIVGPMLAAVVLGRSRQADLRVRDPQASARHCSFALDEVRPSTLVVEDLHSTNGTYIGSRRVDRSPVRHGDTLRVGGATWRVELDEVTPSTNAARTRRNLG